MLAYMMQSCVVTCSSLAWCTWLQGYLQGKRAVRCLWPRDYLQRARAVQTISRPFAAALQAANGLDAICSACARGSNNLESEMSQRRVRDEPSVSRQ